MHTNLILDTDSYKASHWCQYPPGTEYMFSYFESRGGLYSSTVFFGLQYFLKQYLSKPITSADVEEAAYFFEKHGLPFNLEAWLYIAKDLKGKLPICLKALPEGSIVPTGNALFTVESTDPKVFWLVSWLETIFVRMWYPITVATRSRYIKEIIYKYLKQTANNPEEEMNFKLHDFGSRGTSSSESAGLGGMAHLINFQGSDTVQGIRFANHYYNCPMAAFSIPAAEHSTVTSWGREGELLAYKNMLNHFAKPGKAVAIVSDSYDLFNAIDQFWGRELREQIIDSGATIVIRPDSGEPTQIVLKTLDILTSRFGFTVNSKGYKVVNYVKVIQGDGINEGSLKRILETITRYNYSASNLIFGMGGGLLQELNRDTNKFAFKCSAVRINGEDKDVFKDPITDIGKRSKAGRLAVIQENNSYKTIRADELNGDLNKLETVYENGEILREQSLNEIRERLKNYL